MTMLHAGSFYDGRRLSLGVEPTWNVSRHLELSGSYQFNHINFPDRAQQFNVHLGRLRLQATLNTKMAATAFVQYSSATDAVITNVRLRYNPREGNDFYLVYNEGLNIDRRRFDPVLPLVNSRTILAKYTYTFPF